MLQGGEFIGVYDYDPCGKLFVHVIANVEQ